MYYISTTTLLQPCTSLIMPGSPCLSILHTRCSSPLHCQPPSLLCSKHSFLILQHHRIQQLPLVYTQTLFLPNVKAYNVSNGVLDGYVFLGKPQEDIELFMKPAPEDLGKAAANAAAETKRKVSCLVNDSFLWFAAEMAEEMQAPFMPCWLSGSSSLSTHFYTDLIRER